MATGMTRINYDEYKRLGYSMIPSEQFERFAVMARMAVRKFTNGNVDDTDAADENILRGIFEICEVYYSDSQSTESGGRLAGFANEGYREQYFEGANISVNKRVFELIQLYFPKEQLFRGV